MPSKVDICNRALSRVGARRITSLTQDVKRARACDSAWEQVRDEVLRAAPWNCVTERVQLPELGTTPAFGFDHQYAWPSDALRIVEVITTYRWVVESKKILTDEGAPIDVRYIKQETDPNQYDADLVSALAARIAMELAEELTQSNSKRQLAEKEYKAMLKQARRADGQEQSPMEFEDSSWVLARYTSYVGRI